MAITAADREAGRIIVSYGPSKNYGVAYIEGDPPRWVVYWHDGAVDETCGVSAYLSTVEGHIRVARNPTALVLAQVGEAEAHRRSLMAQPAQPVTGNSHRLGWLAMVLLVWLVVGVAVVWGML